MRMTKKMNQYVENAFNFNAFDNESFEEGVKEEITGLINLWEECGKPNFKETGTDLMGSEMEVLLLPTSENGKLIFKAYVYEVEKEIFYDYKKFGEMIPEVTEIDFSKMHFDEEFGDECFGHGTYIVRTNIDF